MNPFLLVSHLLAALLPLILIFIYLSYRRRKQNKEAIEHFWQNQTPEKLLALGLGAVNPVLLQDFPPPFAMILEGESVGVNVQALAFARQLKIFEYIGAHPGLTQAEIAAHFGFDVPALRIALELFVASGTLNLADDGYSLSQATRYYLLEDSPLAMMLPPPVMTERVLRMLRRGETTGSGRHWGMGQSDNPEYWAIKQHVISFPLGFGLAGSGLLGGVQRALDVAGGAGSVAVALASQDPDLSVSLLELPGSVKIARRLVSQYRLFAQIDCVGQDMFADQPWPGSGQMDAVLFTNIFHDWELQRCQVLAEKAFTTLKPGGRIFLQEALLADDRPGPLWTASFSLSLALNTFGRQYRLSELQPLLEKAGFEEVQAHPLLGYYSTIIGKKPVTRRGGSEAGQA